MQSHLLIKEQNIRNIFFAPMQENKILNNSNYTKLLYSTDTITLNGLYFHINLNNIKYYKNFNKYYISFDNVTELHDIITLEKDILHKKFPKKQHIYSIFYIIQQKKLSFYSYKNILITNPFSLIMKISGIWSNDHECGLTYRIYPSVIKK